LVASERRRAEVRKQRDDWCKHRLPAVAARPKHVVFIDETSVKTNLTRQHGWSRRGKLKWSYLLGQVCSVSKVYRFSFYAALCSSKLAQYASSGVRRAVALAYLLTWTWSEHRLAVERYGEDTTRRIIVLFDEVESHLHPRWQRLILKALQDAGNALIDDAEFQFLVSTHSPLILASAEPWFDPDRDAWFDQSRTCHMAPKGAPTVGPVRADRPW